RRVRLRTTALPTRREVMKPARAAAFGSTFFKTPSVSVPPRTEDPSVRTRWNSESKVSRRDFGKRRRFCIGEILICATAVVSCRASASLAEDEWQPGLRLGRAYRSERAVAL